MLKILGIGLVAASLMLCGCERPPRQWQPPEVRALPSRLQLLMNKTKTVCFGRFLMDVPNSTDVMFSNIFMPQRIDLIPNGADHIKAEAEQFKKELKSTKAIYLDHTPLFLSEDEINYPYGRIITGYADFQSLTDIKIQGYFILSNNGFSIKVPAFKREKKDRIDEMIRMAKRVRFPGNERIPDEAGNCVGNGFLVDAPNTKKDDYEESITVDFVLKEYPDTHFWISISPSNPNSSHPDSLNEEIDHAIRNSTSLDEIKALILTQFFRRGKRDLHDWKGVEEVLTRLPYGTAPRYHEFEMRYAGVRSDPLKPHVNITLRTGFLENHSDPIEPSLTTEEVIALWDYLTSTIRVRPTGTASTIRTPS